MDGHLEEMLQDSESEWVEINKLIAIREKKDRKIISMYCSQNDHADIIHILELLEKHKGIPKHDEIIIKNFKDEYPQNLKVETIHGFLDIQDIYREYLESGGYSDD